MTDDGAAGAGAAGGPAAGAPEVVDVVVADADAMRDLGRRLARVLRAGDVVLLDGPLGAGKTTLVQGLGDGLGVRGPVTSPTFVIARVHPSLRGGPALVHVDAYRVGSGWEIDDLDLDADLDDAVTVVEWGAGPARRLAEDRLEVTITRAGGDDHDTLLAHVVGVSDGGEPPREAPTTCARSRTGGTDDGDGPGDPRRVRVRGVGARWAGDAGLAALRA